LVPEKRKKEGRRGERKEGRKEERKRFTGKFGEIQIKTEASLWILGQC